MNEGFSRFPGYVVDYDLTTAVKYAVRALELMPMIVEPAATIFFFQSASFSHSDRLGLIGTSVGLPAPFLSRQGNVCLRRQELSNSTLPFFPRRHSPVFRFFQSPSLSPVKKLTDGCSLSHPIATFSPPTLISFYQLFLNNVEICDSLRVRSRNRNIKISRRGGTLLSSTHVPFTLLIWQDSSLSHHGSRQHSNPNGGPLILRDSPHPCDRCAFHSFGVCEAATKEKGVLSEEISYADHFWRASLHAEDLAFLLGMQQKDLRKLCAKLREDRLIAVYGLPMSSRTLGAHLAEG